MPLTSLQGQMGMLTTEDQYIQAVERITSEIKEKPDSAELFLLRSQNLLKLEKFKEAGGDASRALELGAGAEAYLVQGKALFNVGRFVEALEAFSKGKAKGGADLGKLDQFGQWTTWCEERIKKLGMSDTKNISNEVSMEGKKEDTPAAADDATDDASAANAMPVPKIKHDWYQTEAFVIVTVLVKNLKKEDVKIYFTEKTVSVSAPLPSGSEYSLELDLCHPINPEQSWFRVVPSKVEIKMKKVDGIRWTTLEGDGEPPSIKSSLPHGATEAEKTPAYPTSAPKKHDWDKLEAQVKKEEEEEKLEGDAALNQLFQKIYGQGSEETRRAMNKSFMESGGTVLSTNWKEVAGQKVEVKPPDGMEWKKWNQ